MKLVTKLLTILFHCVFLAAHCWVPQTSRQQQKHHQRLGKSRQQQRSGAQQMKTIQNDNENNIETSMVGAVVVSCQSENLSRDWKVEPLSEAHILPITRMCVQEWGPSGGGEDNVFTLFPRQFLPESCTEICNFIDNYVLATIIYLALFQRVSRKGGLNKDDYKVFCITLVSDNNNDDVVVIGAAELSLQAPYQTASPLCLSSSVKQWLSAGDDLVPYMSNVIVHKSWRRKGFGKRLVMTVEKQARLLGHARLYLHVSPTATSAISLYQKLGYVDSSNDGVKNISDNFVWFNRLLRFALGLYFVTEQRMNYLMKQL